MAAKSPLARRIFLISFNKCGTMSFHSFFQDNGIRSAHHGGNRLEKSLALNMFNNFMLARDPLINIGRYTAFSDMAYYAKGLFLEAARLYQYIHRFYPDSYYILAVRDVDAWLLSRRAHDSGSLVTRAATALGGIALDEVAATWRAQFLAHNAEVRGYFAEQADAHFLEFDLDADDPRRIADFLAPDFAIDVAHWQHRHQTSAEARDRALQRMAAPEDGAPQ